MHTHTHTRARTHTHTHTHTHTLSLSLSLSYQYLSSRSLALYSNSHPLVLLIFIFQVFYMNNKNANLTHAVTHYYVSYFHVFEFTIIVKHHSLAWLTGRSYVTVVHASRNFWLLPGQCFSFWGTNKQPVNQQKWIHGFAIHWISHYKSAISIDSPSYANAAPNNKKASCVNSVLICFPVRKLHFWETWSTVWSDWWS